MRSVFIILLFVFGLTALAVAQCAEAVRFEKKLSNGDGHQFSYIADFYRYKCRCDSGVGSDQEQKQVLAAMKYDIQAYNDYKSSGDPAIGSVPSSCKVRSAVAAGGAGLTNPDKGRIFNDDVMGFMNSLSESSENGRFNSLVQEMNQNKASFDQTQHLATTLFGPLDQDDYDMYNMAENVTQAISVGKFLFNAFSNKEEKKELTPGQKEAVNTIVGISKELRMLYDEVRAMPTFYEFNEGTLDELEAIEANIQSYQRITAVNRLLYWEFTSYDGDMDIRELQALQQKIQREDEEKGRPYTIGRIQQIQNSYTDISAVPHMANAVEGFSGTHNKIQLARAKSFEALGQKDKAAQIRADLSYDVPVKDAVILIQDTFAGANYYGTIEYYEAIKAWFLEHPEVKFIYLDLPDMTHHDVGKLNRTDATYLLGLGVLANIRSGQLGQAHQELLFLKDFHNRLDMAYQEQLNMRQRKKAYIEKSDTEFKAHVLASESIVLAVEAAMSKKTGDHEKALELISQAVERHEESAGFFTASLEKYELWMHFLKAEILIALERYDEANEVTRFIKQHARITFQQENFDMDELRFLGAYLRYRQQDYKGALFALRLLKRSNPGAAKYYVLEEDIYNAMGDPENAGKANRAYVQTLTNSES